MQSVNLSRCSIGAGDKRAEDLKRLRETIEGRSTLPGEGFKSLNLRGNPIGDEGIGGVVHALRTTVISELNVAQCGMSCDGIGSLEEMLRKGNALSNGINKLTVSAALKKYYVEVITGDVRLAGTGAAVSIVLFGAGGSGTRSHVDPASASGRALVESGPHLLDRHALTTEGETPSLRQRYLLAYMSDGGMPSEPREESGPDQHGQVQGASSGVCQLQGGRLNQKENLFARKQTSRFVIYSPAVGDLEQIRISHDAAGLGSDWYLDSVSIAESPTAHTDDNKVWFSCRQWMKDEREWDQRYEAANEPPAIDALLTRHGRVTISCPGRKFMSAGRGGVGGGANTDLQSLTYTLDAGYEMLDLTQAGRRKYCCKQTTRT